MAAVRVTRVYDPPGPDDGARVLVDRLWPRGLAKSGTAMDDWCRDVAPSADLRRWYRHDPERFEEFAARYRDELEGTTQAELVAELRDLHKQRRLTLLTATRAVELSHAAVLAEVIARDSGAP